MEKRSTLPEEEVLKLEKKWNTQIDKFIANPELKEWNSPPGLAPVDRKLIHDIAEKHNLTSVSRGEGKHRIVTVTKQPRAKSSNLINTTAQKKFRDDFDIKINLCEPDSFDYFIDLYDPIYKSKEKYQYLKDAMKQFGSEDAFVNHNDELKEKIVESIRERASFQRFLKDELDKFKIQLQHNEKTGDCYSAENSGKMFVSLDLKSANFNSLRYYDKDIVFDCDNWNQLITKFTNVKYFTENKWFRQKVFWLLEPVKLNTISHYLVRRVSDVLKAHKLAPSDQTIFLNTDEMVFEVDPNEITEKTKNILDAINSSNDISDINNIVRVSVFRMQKLSERYPYFIKEVLFDSLASPDRNWSIDSEPIEFVFKGVTPEHFAVCFKHYFRMELNEHDVRIAWNVEKKDYDCIDVQSLQLLPVHCKSTKSP